MPESITVIIKFVEAIMDSRKFLNSTSEKFTKWNEDLEEIVAKGLYWKRSFMFFYS